MRNVLLALVGVFVILLFAPLLMMGVWMLSGGRMMGSGMMGGYSSRHVFGFAPMIAGGLAFLVFVGLIVVGVYYLFSGRGVSAHHGDRSYEILRERFAKGEITEEQFQTMKKKLQD